jgi:hypothetical protein
MKNNAINIVQKNKRLNSILVTILIFLSIFFLNLNNGLASDSNPDSHFESTRSTISGKWSSTKIWADQEQLKTVAIGDIDPTHDGNELVVGGDSQRITMLKGEEVYWDSKMIWYDNWYTNAITIGDIDPEREGDEVATVGWSGEVTVIFWENDQWQTTEIGKRSDYLYDVAIGDIEPSTSTNEVLVVGDDDILCVYNRNGTDNSWTEFEIFQDLDYLHLVTIGDFYPVHEGQEILVSGGSSRLTMVYFENDTVVSENIYIDKKLINAVQVGNFFNGNPGNEIVAVDTNDEVIMLYYNGTGWVNQTIFEDTNDLYTVQINDIDPEHDGFEIITSGLSNRLIILKEPENDTSGNWDSTILSNPGEQNIYLLANAIGDIDPTHEGAEIATVGYLGKVIKTQFEFKDFKIQAVEDTQVVQAGESVDFEFILTPVGGFDENVELEIVDNPLPLDLQASFDLNSVTLPNLATLQIDIAESIPVDTYVLKINSSNPDRIYYHNLEITVIVESSDSPNFVIFPKPKSQSVIADFTTEYILEFHSVNNFDQFLDISISRLPVGVDAKFNQTTVKPTGSINLSLQTTTITSNRTYYLPVRATSQEPVNGGNVIRHSVVLILIVGETGKQDFVLETTPFSQAGYINQSVEYNIEIISIFGFKSQVTLDVKNLPTGITAMFSTNNVIPTVNVTLTLLIEEDVSEGDYNLEIVGYFQYTEHSSFIKLSISREPPDFEFTINPRYVKINEPRTIEFDVRIFPNTEFRDTLTLTISGLPQEVSWNQDLTPIYIDSVTGIGVKIKTTGETEPGFYNLTFTLTSDSGIEHVDNISLELSEDYGSSVDSESFLPLLIIEIIILIIIIIIVIIYFKIKKSRIK